MPSGLSPEMTKRKIELSSKHLAEILDDFKNGTVSIYHQIRTPRYSPTLDAERKHAEGEWAAMFWMLANDLFDDDRKTAVSFAIRATSKDDPANLQDAIYLMQLERYRNNKNNILGAQAALNPLQQCGVNLLDVFQEKNYVFEEPELQPWLTVRRNTM